MSDLRVAKSNKVILTGIGDALAKYNLGYDSATKEINDLKLLIKDSGNRKTTIIQGDNPIVTFCDEGITLDRRTKDSIAYSIYICSYSAVAIVKNLNAYSLISNYQLSDVFKDLVYIKDYPVIFTKMGMAKEGKLRISRGIVIKSNEVKTIVVLIKGIFTDSYSRNSQKGR